jgi:phosphoribosylformimino-5-aminoimidazole carboxamide ribonucleotide (ProFAR) isomerase
VEISVQVEAEYSDETDVELVFNEAGAYRAVLNAELSVAIERVSALVARFGPRKIVPTLDMHADTIATDADGAERNSPVVRQAMALANCGVERVIADARQISGGPPIHSLLSLVERTNLSVTLNGSVRGFPDLKLLHPLRDRRIDSVILENALYLNAFPCQKIWRQAEQQLIARNEPL